MLAQSFRISRLSLSVPPENLRERFLGLQVHFKSYPELIQLFEEIFIRRVYDAQVETPLVVDCGSHIGISVLYFKTIYPECKIIAFEPEPNNFSILQQTVETNRLQNVTLHNVALADKTDEQFLANPETTSLNWQLNHSAGRKVAVTTHRLSAYIDQPIGLLKMDVEGAEKLIINDLIETRKIDLVETVVLEYHFDGQSLKDFSAILERVGFECHTERSRSAPGATEMLLRARRPKAK